MELAVGFSSIRWTFAVQAMKAQAVYLSIFDVCKYASHIAFLQFRRHYNLPF
jgi:hypothetical protein